MTELDVGQLFVMGFAGTSVPGDVAKLMRDEKIGGAILFSRNIESLEQVVALNTELVALGDEQHPMMISVDQEGGRVARLRGIATDLPSMRAVGEKSRDDEDLPYRLGAMMARELTALGFHLDYAPVVDVDSNPDNPVIGERSFSRDPHEVAAFGAAMIRGMQQAGLAACAKHFPGHGDTDTDSHLELCRVPHDLTRLYDVELVPFLAAAQAHVATVMTAHVMFPALDDELPATLSEKILQRLLRDRIGYDGVIVSDDLEMRGVADHFEIEQLVTLGLNAGVDQFLICHDREKVERAVAAARQGLADGTIDAARVRGALARVEQLKRQFVGAPAAPRLDDARALVRAAPHLALAGALTETASAHARGQSAVDAT